jgi:IS5 family transposase
MKHDGKLDRCHLKGPVGDQIHATLVAAAHNFRMILRKLRLFCVQIFGGIQKLLDVNFWKIGMIQAAA